MAVCASILRPTKRYNPSEVIALCASIIEDGEIAGGEVYDLAEYLNSNPDACDNWPGTLLVPALQATWKDGKATAHFWAYRAHHLRSRIGLCSR